MGARYSLLLNKYPLTTKIVTSGFLGGSGDFICQKIVQKRSFDELDYGRLQRFTFFGTVIVAPTLHLWYGYLAVRFPMVIGSTAMINPAVLQRLAADQLIFAPLFVPASVTTLLLMEKKPLNEIQEQIKNDYFMTLKANWSIWVPAQFLNFFFMPVHYQTIVSGVTSFGWNIILSFLTYDNNDTDHHNKINIKKKSIDGKEHV